MSGPVQEELCQCIVSMLASKLSNSSGTKICSGMPACAAAHMVRATSGCSPWLRTVVPKSGRSWKSRGLPELPCALKKELGWCAHSLQSALPQTAPCVQSLLLDQHVEEAHPVLRILPTSPAIVSVWSSNKVLNSADTRCNNATYKHPALYTSQTATRPIIVIQSD